MMIPALGELAGFAGSVKPFNAAPAVMDNQGNGSYSEQHRWDGPGAFSCAVFKISESVFGGIKGVVENSYVLTDV
jgi:hypothetical protein